MSVEFYRESPGKFDSRTLSRKTLSRWTGRTCIHTACKHTYQPYPQSSIIILISIVIIIIIIIIISRWTGRKAAHRDA